jgi:hypothetical protein
MTAEEFLDMAPTASLVYVRADISFLGLYWVYGIRVPHEEAERWMN